ncbi:MAG: radical SAM protein [Candidatus Pacearchaeota archaeon]
MNNRIRKELRKKSYGLFGETSAVQVCHWTKEAIRGKEGCWKQKFYGIDSARCCQFSPCVMWCDHKCLHCWRPIEMNLGNKVPLTNESPKEILDGIIKERKKLLTGFGGRKGINRKKLEESFEPTLFTMSLSGEATLYPRITELIKEIRRRGAISFLVTNGQHPEVLKKLEKENALPTQLTISLNAPNEDLFRKWHNSLNKDAWKRFNKSLEVIKKLKGKCRRCIRLTLVKKGTNNQIPLNDLTNMVDENVKEYSFLIKKACPDFIHIKGFTSIGAARDRIGYDKQPTHKEIKNYAKKILIELNKNLEKNEKKWKILAEDEKSCVFVLGKNKKEMKIKKP